MRVELLADFGVGAEACNDLDHFHQRHRVEVVVAGKSLRVLQGRSDGRDRQRRGVGGQNRIGSNQSFQLLEDALFDFELFDDGFDDQIASRQVRQGRGGCQAGQVGLRLFGGESAFFDQLGPGGLEAVDGLLAGLCLAVVQQDLAACLGADLGNAPAHGARAHNADDGKWIFHAPIMALLL